MKYEYISSDSANSYLSLLYPFSKTIGAQSASLCVCLFPNSLETTETIELKISGDNYLWC